MRAYRIWCMNSILVGYSLMLVAPIDSHAQAFRFQPQGARAAGQGNAFAAEANDPSAIHYNPAGLTQVEGIQSVWGFNAVGGSVKIRVRRGSTPVAIYMAV